MNSLLKKIVLFALLIASTIGLGQTILLTKNAKISIITCDTGNESYSLFGHTALRITDTEKALDLVYNYGAFDFSTPNFVAKFAKGDLQYFAIANSFTDFMGQYNYEQRTVFEQELNIPLLYKQKLFDNLNAVLASEKKYYTYKFIDKNCTSMVVDMLNKTLGKNVVYKTTDTNKTYRTILFPYFNNFFYQQLGTSIIFGSKVDALGTRLFLPLELHKSLKQIQFNKQPLCKESKTLLEFPKQTTKTWWDNLYTFLFLLVFIIVINNKAIDLLFLFVMGLLGLFFGFMGYYSFHQELACNYNILLFNPFLLVLVYFCLNKNRKWIINLSYLNLFFLLVYGLFMLNKIPVLIVLPLVLTTSILLLKLIFRNSKRIPVII